MKKEIKDIPASVHARLKNLAEQSGRTSIYFVGYLGKASIHLHLDVSFANVISPKEIEVKYPCLLNMPSFEMRGYPYETAISEKFESMVKLGEVNDRMKGFFDIWVLSQQVEIQGASLAKAIRATFKNRKTPLPTNMPIALTSEFAMHRQKDWERFLRRSGLNGSEYPPFSEVIAVLREFIWSVVLAVAKNETFKNTWNARGSWVS